MIHVVVEDIINAKKLVNNIKPYAILSIKDPMSSDGLNKDGTGHFFLGKEFYDSTEGLMSPSYNDFLDIKNFFEKIIKNDDNDDKLLLIHCHAGVSRSTSCAILFLIIYGYDPNKAVEKLFHKIAPHAIPNEKIISMIDDYYELNNKLIDNVNSYYDYRLNNLLF